MPSSFFIYKKRLPRTTESDQIPIPSLPGTGFPDSLNSGTSPQSAEYVPPLKGEEHGNLRCDRCSFPWLHFPVGDFQSGLTKVRAQREKEREAAAGTRTSGLTGVSQSSCCLVSLILQFSAVAVCSLVNLLHSRRAVATCHWHLGHVSGASGFGRPGENKAEC